MLRIGLTGGIGSRKSTVSARLAELGAVVVDADKIAREVVEPGEPALAAIRETYEETGLLAPAGTPPAVVELLNREINEGLRSPELLASYAKLGFEPKITTPQEFEAFLVHELGKWPPLLRAAGVKPD